MVQGFCPPHGLTPSQQRGFRVTLTSLRFCFYSASVGSHFPLVQNNSYAKAAYFAVAYSNLLHCLECGL